MFMSIFWQRTLTTCCVSLISIFLGLIHAQSGIQRVVVTQGGILTFPVNSNLLFGSNNFSLSFPEKFPPFDSVNVKYKLLSEEVGKWESKIEGINFLRQFKVADDGNYIYSLTKKEFYVFDIRIKSAPKLVGSLVGLNITFSNFVIHKKKIILFNFEGWKTSMLLIDITNSTNPKLIASTVIDLKNFGVFARVEIEFLENQIIGYLLTFQELFVLNLTDLTSPKFVKSFPRFGGDSFITKKTKIGYSMMYIVVDRGLLVINLKHPYSPELIKILPLPENQTPWSTINYFSDYLFVVSINVGIVDIETCHKYNIKDPEEPKEVEEIHITNKITEGIMSFSRSFLFIILNPYFGLAGSTQYLYQIFDISDIKKTKVLDLSSFSNSSLVLTSGKWMYSNQYFYGNNGDRQSQGVLSIRKLKLNNLILEIKIPQKLFPGKYTIVVQGDDGINPIVQSSITILVLRSTRSHFIFFLCLTILVIVAVVLCFILFLLRMCVSKIWNSPKKSKKEKVSETSLLINELMDSVPLIPESQKTQKKWLDSWRLLEVLSK